MSNAIHRKNNTPLAAQNLASNSTYLLVITFCTSLTLVMLGFLENAEISDIQYICAIRGCMLVPL